MRNILFFLILFANINSNGQEAPISTSEVEGKWLLNLNSHDIGSVNTIFEFDTKGDSFEAWTRKGADRDILGLWKSSLARLFTDDFKKGSLVRLTDGKVIPRGDTLVLAGIFRSAIGNYYFNGEIYEGELKAILRNGKKEIKGQMSGRKTLAPYPLEDYPAIISEALDTAKTRIYNREELKTPAWKVFEEKITEKAVDFQDDVELVFGFYYFASKLPFSHFNLTRMEELKAEEAQHIKEQFLFLEELDSNTALLKITSFGGSAQEVDSIFDVIIKRDYDNLIVDLRNNAGGTVEAGLTFASRVVDTPLVGGIFLTQKWFNQNPHLPDRNQLKDFPVFSEANYDLIIDGIHHQEGLLLKVKPSEPVFGGKLFVLTNSRTASTCEPLVAGLKSAQRAILVGQTTAGAMLNGEKFNLQSGFSVFVPTADFYTIDGERIDQVGVQPNVVLKDEDALEYTVSQLIK